ncbi:MAG TPA: type-F conjugative transfer system secretin TraK [Gammaproteobacteria bacterium]|nr:type-F conjugative transfer system secretin TraK [Gammaproteobacteria bacterium]
MHKLTIILLLIAPLFAGAHTVRVNDNTTVKANISALEPTRISVAGDRISSIRGVEGAYTYKNDNSLGAIFIKPSEAYQHKSFYIFIATEQNHSYVLQLTPTSAAAGFLVLQPKPTSPSPSSQETDSPYETQLSNLMRLMVNGTGSDEYAMNLVHSNVQRWNKQLNISVLAVFEGSELQGTVYRIKNRSHQLVSLNELLFYRSGDRAIALQNDQIPAQGQTLLYKVTHHG